MHGAGRAGLISFGRERIHKPRPALINFFEDENGVIDCPVHEVSFRHVRFVRVHVDEFPSSQNRCGKQNGEFSFLGHVGTPTHWNNMQGRKSREGQFTFSCPTSP